MGEEEKEEKEEEEEEVEEGEGVETMTQSRPPAGQCGTSVLTIIQPCSDEGGELWVYVQTHHSTTDWVDVPGERTNTNGANI